jgi:hypothetical protein
VGAANDLRDTASFISRNENDSASSLAKTTWRLARSARGFPAKLQGFESVRGFETKSRRHNSGHTKNKNHKLVMFDGGGIEFSNKPLALCR